MYVTYLHVITNIVLIALKWLKLSRTRCRVLISWDQLFAFLTDIQSFIRIFNCLCKGNCFISKVEIRFLFQLFWWFPVIENVELLWLTYIKSPVSWFSKPKHVPVCCRKWENFLKKLVWCWWGKMLGVDKNVETLTSWVNYYCNSNHFFCNIMLPFLTAFYYFLAAFFELLKSLS